jgi:hypothetical protein
MNNSRNEKVEWYMVYHQIPVLIKARIMTVILMGLSGAGCGEAFVFCRNRIATACEMTKKHTEPQMGKSCHTQFHQFLASRLWWKYDGRWGTRYVRKTVGKTATQDAQFFKRKLPEVSLSAEVKM